MSWFRKRAEPDPAPGGGDAASAASPSPTGADEVPAETIGTSALPPEERASIEASLARLEAAGVDLSDPRSLSAATDAGQVEREAAVAQDLAVGLGEYLVRTAGYRWVLVSDSFGVDRGVENRRGTRTVVPRDLIAARWMRGETGWLPGVLGHLATL